MLRLRERLCTKKENDRSRLAYFISRTGIGPEAFAFTSTDGGYTGRRDPPSVGQILFDAQHGFYITAADYILRPEVLESNFYAWRVTGDAKYLDRAAQAIKSFQTYLTVSTGGYTGIMDVTDNGASGQPRVRVDDTESFWFAEVLKYLYVDLLLESIKIDFFFFFRFAC